MVMDGVKWERTSNMKDLLLGNTLIKSLSFIVCPLN